ncbi:MAG: hypothetical protein IBX50_16795 [Marinospirillum sp.]|uniref:hypothetical protein n=1 Tax=Marinospirillum sp. TaxID=2183934 RepID=UPI0019F6FABA|nr:hypothetical protein [Marinospirillum sp.]MBE0508348.1 hypothetical protein [Marinospirillum sp.]
MLMLKLKQAFGTVSQSSVKHAQQKSQQRIRTKVVTTLSRGNVSLQNGRFLTKKDLDERLDKVVKHSFL